MTTSLQKDALLSQFANLAYKDRDFLSNPGNLPPGWTLKDDSVSPPFAAFAFKNDTTGEVVIAYRGTDGINDGSGIASVIAGTWDPQFKQGMDFVAKVQGDRTIFPLGTDPSTLLVTGHSLGGTIAQIVAFAYHLDGSTIDPGAAARIVATEGFLMAAKEAGLLPANMGAAASFTNFLGAGSAISSSTGEHIGQPNLLPSLTLSGPQALMAGLISLVNPIAAIAFAIGTDQVVNKHAAAQLSNALGLLAGALDGNAGTPGAIKIAPKELDPLTNPVTGESTPVFSQTEFEIRDAASGALLNTVKFSGTGAERMIEVFNVGGVLQSTTTLAATGAITLRPVAGPTIVVGYLPEVTHNQDGTVTVTTKDPQGNVLSSRDTQTFDDGSTLSTTRYPGGRVELLATDDTGAPSSLQVSTPAGNNTEKIDLYSFDASGQRVIESSRVIETLYDENGQSRIETVTTYADGVPSTVRNTYGTDGSLLRSEALAPPSVANLTEPQAITVLNDVAGLIGAVQSGRPLPVLQSGLHVVNDLVNPAGRSMAFPGLNLTTGVVDGLIASGNFNGLAAGGVKELRSLAEVGITAIDYSNSRYEFDSSSGTNDGGYGLIFTKTPKVEGETNGLNEDGTSGAYNPNTQGGPIAITISAARLLGNDTWHGAAGSAAGLVISGVGNGHSMKCQGPPKIIAICVIDTGTIVRFVSKIRPAANDGSWGVAA